MIFFANNGHTSKPLFRRVMVTLIGIIALLSIVLELMLWNHYDGHAKEHMTQNINRINQSQNLLLNEQAQVMYATLQVIATDKETKEALQANNSSILLSMWQSAFEAMKNETQIKYFTFYDVQRKVLLRLHEPSRHGDMGESTLFKMLYNKRSFNWGIEVSIDGSVSLKVLHALYDNGRLIGYVELGQSIESILKLLQKSLKSEIAILIHKRHLQKEAWQAAQHEQMVYPWNSLSQSVVNYSSMHITAELFNIIENMHQKKYNKEIKYKEQFWFVSILELKDVAGEIAGDVLVLYNINDIKLSYYKFVIESGAIGILLIFIIIVPVYFLLRNAQVVFKEKEEVLKRLDKIGSRITGFMYQFRLRPDGSSCIPFASAGIYSIYHVYPEEVTEDASKVFDVLHPDDYDGIVSSIQTSAKNLIPWKHEYRVQFKDGTIRWIYGSAIPEKEADGSVLWHGYIDDITSRKQMEMELKALNEFLDAKVEQEVAAREKIQKEQESDRQMLIQKSKLSSMGEMMGAIAHQWRQPLNALNMNIQNLEDDFDEGLVTKSFIQKYIAKNRQTIAFLSKTIDDFRNFFKIDKEKKEFSALEAIYETLSLQMEHFKSHHIVVKVDGKDLRLYGFKGEFQQVILNIINNAKDAILERKLRQGMISITLDEKAITIENNGGTIKPSILERIFEPYFTTKEQKEGTGIGLYMSKVIIEKNMGWKLSAENIPNGARFKILF